jgi:hypothetical protein
LLNRTRATFRIAEFGFLGVVVKTLRQTPRLKGAGYFFGLFFKTLKPKLKATRFVGFFAVFLFFLSNW